MKCSLCEDCGWVCESHPDRPWEGEHACACGGAGRACLARTAIRPITAPRRGLRRVQNGIRQGGLASLSPNKGGRPIVYHAPITPSGKTWLNNFFTIVV